MWMDQYLNTTIHGDPRTFKAHQILTTQLLHPSRRRVMIVLCPPASAARCLVRTFQARRARLWP